MSFPKYPEYKDSGVSRIGLVPKHWVVGPLKRMLDIQNGADHKAVERDDGIPVIGSGGPFTFAADFLYDGESVLLGRKGTIDKPLYVTGQFWTVDTMYWSRILPGTFGKFAYYVALTVPFDYYSTSTALPSMTKGVLGAHLVACPPIGEQIAIATFLDHETGKIDALIAEQEKLIALLAEKRQATISHAVTRGLNPDAPMKDSGVAWLGEVPAHWEVCAVRRVVKRIEQGWSPECFNRPAEGPEWAVLKAGCVNGGAFNASENKALPEDLEPDPRIEVRDGDLLMSRASGSPIHVGATAYVFRSPPRLMLSDKIFRLRLRRRILPRFFAMAFGSRYMRHQIEQAISGAEGLANNLPQSSLKTFAIAVPPVDEQLPLVAFVETEADKLDTLKAEVERAIALLKERRSALIAAAVTGQIDVRDVVMPQTAEAALAN